VKHSIPIMTRYADQLKNIEDASIPEEWMTADLMHPDTNVEYHVRGEMFVCPYTDKTVEGFKADPQFKGLVAHICLSYTVGSSDKIRRTSFYYNPLEEQFLDEATFEDLQDGNTEEVFLAMDGKRPGIMKGRRVLHEAGPLRYIPNVEDVVQGPEALSAFSKMFLERVF